MMDFILDPPSPWSLSPVDVLQRLGDLLPTSLGRLIASGVPLLGRITVAGLSGGLGWFSRAGRGKLLCGLGMGAAGFLLAKTALPALVAVWLIYITLVTYHGSARATGPRLTLIIALRLFALLLAIVTIVRPA